MAASSQKTGSYHHGNLRRAVIDAALGIVAEYGINALTVREVAKRAGVSRTAPYRHFENKDALLAVLAQEGFEKFYVAEADGLRQAPLEPLQRLQALGVACILFAAAQPTYYRLMFNPITVTLDRSRYPELHAAAIKTFEVLVAVVVECQQIQCVKAHDPKQLAQVLWALVHGAAMLIIDGQLDLMGYPPVEEFARLATWSMIAGVKR